MFLYFVIKWLDLLWWCFWLGFDCAGAIRMEGKHGQGQGSEERSQRVSSISPQKSTTFGCSATEFAGFYRKSAGDPTGNSRILQEVCEILQDVWPWEFWVMVKWWSGMGGYVGRRWSLWWLRGRETRWRKSAWRWLVVERMGSTKGQENGATWIMEVLEGKRAEQRSVEWL